MSTSATDSQYNSDHDNPVQDTAASSASGSSGSGYGDSAYSDSAYRGSRSVPLRRAYHGRMLSGVAAGLADYFGVDATLVRLGFVLLTIMGGAGVPVYLAALLLIPEEGTDESLASQFIGSIQAGR